MGCETTSFALVGLGFGENGIALALRVNGRGAPVRWVLDLDAFDSEVLGHPLNRWQRQEPHHFHSHADSMVLQKQDLLRWLAAGLLGLASSCRLERQRSISYKKTRGHPKFPYISDIPSSNDQRPVSMTARLSTQHQVDSEGF